MLCWIISTFHLFLQTSYHIAHRTNLGIWNKIYWIRLSCETELAFSSWVNCTLIPYRVSSKDMDHLSALGLCIQFSLRKSGKTPPLRKSIPSKAYPSAEEKICNSLRICHMSGMQKDTTDSFYCTILIGTSDSFESNWKRKEEITVLLFIWYIFKLCHGKTEPWWNWQGKSNIGTCQYASH